MNWDRITNSPVASTFIVYARTNKEGPPSKGITAFLVERGFKGFEVGEKLDKFGVSSSFCTRLHQENRIDKMYR